MNTISEWIILFGGIIATVFFNKIRTRDVIALGSDSKTDEDIKEAVRIPIMILVFIVGLGFIASAIYNIFDLSVLSATISVLGYLLFRFYLFFGRKLRQILKNKFRILISVKFIQISCLILGIIVIILGMLNLI